VPGKCEVGSIVLAILSGNPGRLAAQAAVLVTVVGGSAAYASVNNDVTLNVDGRTTEVRALAGTVGDLLKDQDLKVGPRDIVAPSPDTKIDDGDTVVVRFARQLTVTVDGQKRTFWTTELSVDRALAAMGIRADGARLSASRSARIERAGMTMWLSTPKQVTLTVDRKVRKLTTTAPTVSELLKEQSVELSPTDKLSAVPSAPVTDNMAISVARVVAKRVTKTEAVAFPVTERRNSSMFKGDEKIVKKGVKGSRTAVYDVVRTNGKITARKLVSAKVTKAPVAQIVEVGTKNRPSSGGNVGGSVDSLNWAALAECESGGNPNAVNPAGPYYGLYQFSLPTWRSVGGTGKPTDFGAAEQTLRAKKLYIKAGPGQWPVCGKRL
jgi:resuscitation-promoting factor RpfB